MKRPNITRKTKHPPAAGAPPNAAYVGQGMTGLSAVAVLWLDRGSLLLASLASHLRARRRPSWQASIHAAEVYRALGEQARALRTAGWLDEDIVTALILEDSWMLAKALKEAATRGYYVP